MTPVVARLLVIGAGIVAGWFTYAGVSYLASFIGCLGFQATRARFEIDKPSRFTEIGFTNGKFARFSTVAGLTVIGVAIAASAIPISGSLGASVFAAIGGAALALAIIFAKPDLLLREGNSQ